MRLVGPYEQHMLDERSEHVEYKRFAIDRKTCYSVYWTYTKRGHKCQVTTSHVWSMWDNIEDAMMALDTWLVDNGYKMLTQEQYDKLRLLI